jgi:uncharacterized protein with PIN domain
MVESETPRFVADAMVGKLARWLRVLGVDVLYDASLDDRQLLALARREGRVLLTRDLPLASGSRGPERLLIESDDFREQLLQVVATYRLDPWRGLFSRCMDCNTPLEPALREEARHQVPPYVFSTKARFKRCQRCDKILWEGTHRNHMRRVLEGLFAE